jgi:hypothetical protein
MNGLPVPHEHSLSLAPAISRLPRNMTVPQSMQTPLNSPAGNGTADPHHEQESSVAVGLRNLNFSDMRSAGICTFLS